MTKSETVVAKPDNKPEAETTEKVADDKDKVAVEAKEGNLPKDETGGRKEGLDPTRYNDWEMKGRCIDF